MITLRFARPEDAAALAEIYRPYVEETSISFETEAPSAEEFARRMGEFSRVFPYLAAEEKGTLLGYAYAHAFHERAAYDWTVETSIYVRKDARGRHIGQMLYGGLLPLLKEQGVINACAVVTYPNDPSMAFHAAMGFREAGLLPNAGYKFGAWHSVSYLWLRLREDEGAPTSLRPVSALPAAMVERILKKAAEIS